MRRVNQTNHVIHILCFRLTQLTVDSPIPLIQSIRPTNTTKTTNAMARRASSTAKIATNTTTTTTNIPDRTLIIDPGAYTLKAGFASTLNPDVSQTCKVIPNCVAKSARDNKTYIGSQLETCLDFGEMQFKRPVQKGYIVNWQTQAAIWDKEFLDAKSPLACDPHDTNLVLTEPASSPQALQSNTDQIIFEEFEFASAYRTLGPVLNAYTDTASLFGDSPPPTSSTHPLQPAECLLLIDSGHSHTTITPLLRGQPLHSATRRITLGGKHLSNYLSELISLRHFSLIDEPHIVSQMKEDVCFVSSNFARDLEHTWKGGVGDQGRPDLDHSIVVDYVLPDYERYTRGFMRPHNKPTHQPSSALLDPSLPKEESFPLANERFVVPELLFSPSDVGYPESGIPGTAMQCVAGMTPALQQGFLGNVVLVGGNVLMPGLLERVQSRLDMLAGDDVVVRVRRAGELVFPFLFFS